MNCIQSAFELFQTNTCAVTLVAVLFFLLGAAATCVACKVRCLCGAKGNGDNCVRRPTQKKFAREPKFEKTHPAPADGSIEIYVGNLSYDLTEEQLRKEFEAFGTVNSARIITNRYNGRSKGFGFVHMPNRAEVDAALKALSDKEILGRKLKCNEAKNVG